MRRRVLHVTEAPGWGIYSLLVEFTREQTARGDDVHILAPAAMRRLPEVTHHDWSVARGKPWTYPRGILDLRRTVAEVQPDVVHLHSFFGGFFGRLPLVAGLRDTPVVYQPHAWAFNVVELARAKTAIQRWERSAGRRTDAMVANCVEEVDEGRAAGAAASGIALGIALDTDRFHPADAVERAAARTELGLGGGGVLLCLGRQAKQKGQDQLVQAWERAPVTDAQLVLVGIDEPAELAALAPTQWDETVRAVASVSDVRPWLAACDLLVMPSRYEGSAVTVPEAMASGRPVVTTAVNGVQEQVADGPHPPAGAVVALGDMTELLAQCARRLADPELLAAESAAARERAVEMFGTGVVVDRLDRAYEQAIATRARRSHP